jgi:hypothetical protein
MPSRRVPPVDRLQRVSRERDRPSSDGEQRRKRSPEPPEQDEREPGEDGRPHIDVRA